MTISNMEWRKIERFPNWEISEYGDIRNIESHRRLKGYQSVDGYLTYVLNDEFGEKKHVFAHRLVCEVFNGKPPSTAHQVAHCNGSRVYHHYSNLRWATHLENQDDRKLHLTNPVGEKNPNSKLTEDMIRQMKIDYHVAKLPKSGIKIKDIAERYGIHHATLCNIVKGKSWSHI